MLSKGVLQQRMKKTLKMSKYVGKSFLSIATVPSILTNTLKKNANVYFSFPSCRRFICSLIKNCDDEEKE